MTLSAILAAISIVILILGVYILIKEQRNYTGRPEMWPAKKKHIMQGFTFVAAVFLISSFWTYKPASILISPTTNSNNQDQSKATSNQAGTVKYDYYSDGNDDLQLTTVTVNLQDKYDIPQLTQIAAEVKKRGWPSDRLAISFRIKGDSLIKAALYATAKYDPRYPEKAQPEVAISEFYDSDSTIYYRDHPAKK